MHSKKIPTGAGLVIMMSFIVSLYWLVEINNPALFSFIVSYIAIALFGFSDDIFDFSSVSKAAFQLIFSLFFINEIGLELYISDAWYLNLLFTAVYSVFIINAFNLIDGIDGLLILLSILFLCLFIIIGYGSIGLGFNLSIIMIAVLCSIFFFNRHPAKFFLGDSGSMAVGWTIAVISLDLSINHTSRFVDVVQVIMLPAFDLVCVAIYRFRSSGGSIFKKLNSIKNPDRNHIHHILMSRGYSINYSIIIILVVSIALFSFYYIFNNLVDSIGIWTDRYLFEYISILLCFCGYYYWRIFMKNTIN